MKALRSVRTSYRISGFTLVEVTLALGLVAFCLIAILGLIPVGLDSIRDGNRQAEASRIMKQIATGLHAAHADEDENYYLVAAGTLGEINWKVGDPEIGPLTGMMTASGTPTSSVADAMFSYSITIDPPADYWVTGRALIRIAWPAQAVWNGSGWDKSTGNVTSLVLFSAK